MNNPVPIAIFHHGGRTRNMLTIEVGRKSIKDTTLYDVDEVMAHVRHWLETSLPPRSDKDGEQ